MSVVDSSPTKVSSKRSDSSTTDTPQNQRFCDQRQALFQGAKPRLRQESISQMHKWLWTDSESHVNSPLL